jgi:hypothetical protein
MEPTRNQTMKDWHKFKKRPVETTILSFEMSQLGPHNLKCRTNLIKVLSVGTLIELNDPAENHLHL